jgi:hypothetical protein
MFLSDGSIYTVAEIIIIKNEHFYNLAEIPINPFTGNAAGFLTTRFVPISHIDENSFERNYEFDKIKEGI